MKGFLKILAASFLVFMTLAMAQEWEIFYSAWFGGDAPAPAMPETDRQGAVDAVALFLRLSAHLQGTGGDPRFAERLPATPPVIDELMADVALQRHRHRLQEPRLMRLEILGVDPLRDRGASVRTREFWVTRTLWMDGSAEAGPPRSDIVYCRYSVVRENDSWRVWAWEPEDGEGGDRAVPGTTAFPPETARP